MQMDRRDMKVEKSVSMHLHVFERHSKRQMVTDTKSRNPSKIIIYEIKQKTVKLGLDYYFVAKNKDIRKFLAGKMTSLADNVKDRRNRS